MGERLHMVPSSGPVSAWPDSNSRPNASITHLSPLTRLHFTPRIDPNRWVPVGDVSDGGHGYKCRVQLK